jgi:hypothetical protein
MFKGMSGHAEAVEFTSGARRTGIKQARSSLFGSEKRPVCEIEAPPRSSTGAKRREVTCYV